MGLLFEIAMNKENDLQTRYAATRTMQGLKEKREKLSRFELRVYRVALGCRRERLHEVLDMSKDAVNSTLYRIRSKGYEVKQIFEEV